MIVTYTKTGTRHQSLGQNCQDAVFYRDTPDLTFLALADGVSACENSRIGAELACRTAAEYVIDYASTFHNCDETKIAYLILDQVRYELENKAREMDWEPETLASTLSFCCIRKSTREVLVFHLGDGGIYTMQERGLSMLLPPDGRPMGPANTITRNNHRAAQVRSFSLPNSARFFLCSDGVVKLLRSHPEKDTMVAALESGDYKTLGAILDRIDSSDDCGFIAY